MVLKALLGNSFQLRIKFHFTVVNIFSDLFSSLDLVNECELGTHQCDTHAKCTDTSDAYECVCNPGYNGNGTYCSGKKPAMLSVFNSKTESTTRQIEVLTIIRRRKSNLLID